MPNTKALDEHYRNLSDTELLKLAAQGGLTDKAESVLSKELARRNLTFDEAKRHFAPPWLDKADVGAVGIIVLENGERITAEVSGLNEVGDRLSVKVIPPDGLSRSAQRSHRDIPFRRIASFEPRPHLMEQCAILRSLPTRKLASTLPLDVSAVPLHDRGQPASIRAPDK